MAGRSEREFGYCALDRLHRPAEFAAVRASRSRRLAGCFELRFLKRPQGDKEAAAGQARLGLVIPKRLAKRAVLRNLLKRLARESFRSVRPGLPPVDVVLRLTRPPLAAGQTADRAQRLAWRRSIDELLAGVVAP